MLITALFLTTLFLAYTNGANDNFKGVATLYGSGVVSYKTAISIATITTFIGSICAIFLAQELISNFSGKGLIPQNIAETPDFLIAVGLGAGGTVLLATRLGFPISTTHSLVGGLLGAGVAAIGLDVNFHKLGSAFLLPLLASPFIAFALGILVYGFFTRTRKAMGLTKETCICMGEQKEFIPLRMVTDSEPGVITLKPDEINQVNPTLVLADNSTCVDLYTDSVWRISVQKLLDIAHVVSAAAVSFARGLNDTPKIAGLLVATQAFDIRWGMVAIAIGMATGGLLSARRVAETMSNKITEINHGQGFSANLVTSFLVIIASKFGVPVSTTHVSVGSIFGIGVLSNNANNKVIKSIILSWIITLPVAMTISASTYWFFY